VNMKREILVNPIIEIRMNGEQICRQKLQELELEEIKFIIAEHSYNPFKMLTKEQKKNKEYLINFLICRAGKLCKLGQVFRTSDLEKDKQY